VIPDFINKNNIDETIKKAKIGNLTPQAFNDTIISWVYENSKKYLTFTKKKFCH